MGEHLVLEGVYAGYGDTTILEDVSLALPKGSVWALLGRNGAGKSTLLSTILGRTTFKAGRIAYEDTDVSRLPIHLRARMGMGLVPQEREIFHSLSVEDNLQVCARPGEWNIEAVYELFPRLAQRRENLGSRLSGGEQQMLAFGRALIGNPRLLLLDEPLEGLAPAVADVLLDAILKLKSLGQFTIVLVEQHATVALEVTERAIVLNRGRISYLGQSADLLDDEELLTSLVSC
ncbi:ABC transporter ATP-binding protein [Pusillimonas noertemannii]|uniref:Amino acid/amide ABC transporter ATP-binding protein 2 (HAAT family) n=1 Tax=Pusillimonas noertemannii TaxID=305977 RepID=A0A2U1CJZ8_9BURK|nr:ABC transporter ATP-binding protein [Pusillimonas noertemannii]NYT69764.1 ABC transporter ATP-binding protein [Pusillimonas noertemannii]PVY61312.1 amino acid/amide ABC transporter ATP-binding protein 2 (HAAT family) [Pusillimonas noertemannii]TFL09070.1 ABC transporter ATP-binding protein [Pusillimonas noertemannii]